MNITVQGPAEYQGVSVAHPSIVRSIENLVKQGRTNEHICQVVGMPVEVIDRVRHRLNREKEQKKK